MGTHKLVDRSDAHPPGDVDDFLDVAEVAEPATPASGFGRIYAKADGLLYFKDDAGTEYDLTSQGVIPEDSALEYIYRRPSGESAHADDDEFGGNNGAGVPPGWTGLTVSGSASWSESGHAAHVVADAQSAGDWAVIGKALTAPSAPMTIETAITTIRDDDNNNHMVALGFADGLIATSNIALAHIWTPTQRWSLDSGSFTTGTGGDPGGFDVDIPSQNGFLRLFVRLIWTVGTSMKIQVSPDGLIWSDFDVAAWASGVTPSHAWLGVSTWAGGKKFPASFDYFRRYNIDTSA